MHVPHAASEQPQPAGHPHFLVEHSASAQEHVPIEASHANVLFSASLHTNAKVGLIVGSPVGFSDGFPVGEFVGVSVGLSVGESVGLRVGAFVHVPHAVSVQPHPSGHVHLILPLPSAEHAPPFVTSQVLSSAEVQTSLNVGVLVGCFVGSLVGAKLGATVGSNVGVFVGDCVGTRVGEVVHDEQDGSAHPKPFLQLHTLVEHFRSAQRHMPLVLSHWFHSSAEQPPGCVGFVVG